MSTYASVVGKEIISIKTQNLKNGACDWMVLVLSDGTEISVSGYSEPFELEIASPKRCDCCGQIIKDDK